MIRINEAVIVEGKYDKIKLKSLIDATVIETHGFSIFKDKSKLALIRRLAKTRGILIITDSDAAGFKIRHYLCGALPQNQVKNAYIPDIYGKEPRKQAPGKEGKLGLEGIPAKAVMDALEKAGVLCETAQAPRRKISKTDLFEDMLCGTADCTQRRARLLSNLNLPERLSSNGLLEVLNAMFSYEEYKKAVAELERNE